jgi:hypothetical protein
MTMAIVSNEGFSLILFSSRFVNAMWLIIIDFKGSHDSLKQNLFDFLPLSQFKKFQGLPSCSTMLPCVRGHAETDSAPSLCVSFPTF